MSCKVLCITITQLPHGTNSIREVAQCQREMRARAGEPTAKHAELPVHPARVDPLPMPPAQRAPENQRIYACSLGKSKPMQLTRRTGAHRSSGECVIGRKRQVRDMSSHVFTCLCFCGRSVCNHRAPLGQPRVALGCCPVTKTYETKYDSASVGRSWRWCAHRKLIAGPPKTTSDNAAATRSAV